MNTRYLLIVVLMFLSVLKAEAEQIPVPLSSDARVRTVSYHKDNVVKLYSHYLFPTVIQFAEYEKIIGVFPGDASAWKIIRAGNRLIVKPIKLGQDIHTNLYVVASSGRDYHFTLIGNYTKNPKDHKMVYKLKFVYQDDLKQAAMLQQEKQNRISSSVIRNERNAKAPSLWNLNYSYSGDKSILPVRVFDDGDFTYFEFSKNQEIPAIFFVHPDTRESLVNSRSEGRYQVVERIGGQFTLRAGKGVVACIFNEPYLKAYKIRNKQTKVKTYSEIRNKQKPNTSVISK